MFYHSSPPLSFDPWCPPVPMSTVDVRSLAIFLAFPFMVMMAAQTARLSVHSLLTFLHHLGGKRTLAMDTQTGPRTAENLKFAEMSNSLGAGDLKAT